MEDLTAFSKIKFNNQQCYRLIPSKFPPIALFEDVANDDEFEALYAVQSLTNPRIQDDIGNLSLLPADERVYAIPGCGYIMAAFTHINPDGSRFSNGDFGVYYASASLDTAIAETVYHRERFLKYTQEPAQEIDMRALVANFNAHLYDLSVLNRHLHSLYSKTEYIVSQRLGHAVKEKNEDGLVYHSVRGPNHNYALFKPKLITSCLQSGHYCYVWNGQAIQRIYKKVSLVPN